MTESAQSKAAYVVGLNESNLLPSEGKAMYLALLGATAVSRIYKNAVLSIDQHVDEESMAWDTVRERSILHFSRRLVASRRKN